jgi:ADP-dependent NAD(P)H-hydrate dehydratase / NAD(P)H-hydrate epimerase
MLSDGDARPHGPPDLFGRADVPLPTAAESAAADRAAGAEHAVPERLLMDNAGRAAALVLCALYPRGRVAVVAGKGNNGGDGAVLARTLHAWGRDVTLIPIAGESAHAPLLHGESVPVLSDEDAGAAALLRADLIVDALLGTGASGPPRGVVAAWLARIRAAGRPVLSLDLPSGVDPTTGEAHDGALMADATVCFGWPKLGLMLHPARAHCGRLVAVEIGFPPAVAAGFGAALITPGWAAARLPARPPTAHKGTAGRLLLLAGSPGMAGAAAISAIAAGQAGVGYLRIVSAADNRPVLQTLVPEAIFHATDELSALYADSLDAAAVGPGLGTDDAALNALLAVLRLTDGLPTVLDADALNLYAREEQVRAAAGGRPLVLTPHPGELGRMLGRETGEITASPVACAREAADRFDAVVLLKGQPSIVAMPGEPLLVNSTGSSDLATAGMGDQLTGTVGALLAAGLGPRDAAGVALFYAGRAGDLARHGRSLTPTALSHHFRHAVGNAGAPLPPAGLAFVTFDQPPRR